jgi:Protein of unknown function (DUF3768)
MIDPHNISSQKIAAINDLFRSSLGVPTFCGRIPGQIVMTAGVAACSPADQTAILRKVRDFNNFPEDDDPYGEHDFGAFDHAGERLFWKFDYYAPGMERGSEDPADLSKTVRVLTILFASEW